MLDYVGEVNIFMHELYISAVEHAMRVYIK